MGKCVGIGTWGIKICTRNLGGPLVKTTWNLHKARDVGKNEFLFPLYAFTCMRKQVFTRYSRAGVAFCEHRQLN